MSDFENHLQSLDAPEDLPGPEGLLFTGDAIRFLTPEQIATIGDFANRMFGVEMRPIHHVRTELTDADMPEEHETEPVPVTRNNFLDFADRHGYPKQRARIAWNTVAVKRVGDEKLERFKGDDLPPLRMLRTELSEYDPSSAYEDWYAVSSKDQVVDLKSVYAILRRCQVDRPSIDPPFASPHITVPFLAHICNEVLQPDEPILFDTERYTD
jgi:hypothetical protein